MVVKGIVGLSLDAGARLLARLLEHATSSAYVYTRILVRESASWVATWTSCIPTPVLTNVPYLDG